MKFFMLILCVCCAHMGVSQVPANYKAQLNKNIKSEATVIQVINKEYSQQTSWETPKYRKRETLIEQQVAVNRGLERSSYKQQAVAQSKEK
ncbi:hypothetical protein G9H61_12320 [Aquirufa ecclesiirivi]|uniref:Uncharacterized protein n=1 Tax=Aquirufa ecclesiirivi TaxID=2715124 RepID=A0ABT4JJ69_9BACT|nr:hypothetical protein [Aquirufa ecclesiirivi]MCZ2476233.1 hypothetical protein [Aquirufa ecclesiirivi]